MTPCSPACSPRLPPRRTTCRCACTWPSCWPPRSGFPRRCRTSRTRSTVQPGNAAAIALLQRLGAMLATPAAPAAPQPPTEFDWGQAEDQVRDIAAAGLRAGLAVRRHRGHRPGRAPVAAAGRRRRHGARQATAGAVVPRPDPQPAAGLGVRQDGRRRAAALRPARLRQDVHRPRRGRRDRAPGSPSSASPTCWTCGPAAASATWPQIFAAARRNAPCVLFFDEVDALGQKRSHLTTSSSMRNTVNQLLSEMDSLGGRNDGVFVLGATNHPWDVDSALRRPGRFDRMLLVLPPDGPARAAILRHHLRDRPWPASTSARSPGPPSTTPGPTSRTCARPRPSGPWPSRCGRAGWSPLDHERPADRGAGGQRRAPGRGSPRRATSRCSATPTAATTSWPPTSKKHRSL